MGRPLGAADDPCMRIAVLLLVLASFGCGYEPLEADDAGVVIGAGDAGQPPTSAPLCTPAVAPAPTNPALTAVRQQATAGQFQARLEQPDLCAGPQGSGGRH